MARPRRQRQPLQGVRVLELGVAWIGPWAATLLGDLGAEVVKVEAIQRYDFARGPLRPVGTPRVYADQDPGAEPWNRQIVFNSVNRSKCGITLDLARLQGRRLFERLTTISDVVLTNYLAGVMDRLSLGYERLRALRPDLIMVEASGYGASGPYAQHVAMGGSLDGAAGHLWLRAYPDEDHSLATGITHLDTVGGLTAVFAILAALHHRRLTGRGQHVDLSACEAFIPHIGEAVLAYTMNGEVWGPVGNASRHLAPQGCYPCRGDDRWLTLAVGSDTQWARLCELMGRPELAQDSRFATNAARRRYAKELDEAISAWTRNHDHYELFHALQQAGIPAGPVVDNAEAYADPHLQARGYLLELEDATCGRRRYQGSPWRFSRTPTSVRRPPPRLGADTQAVLAQLLGLGTAELVQLEREAVVGTEPLGAPAALSAGG